jgi:hypothetical protein
MATTKDIIADFEAWQTKLFQTLVKATKAANAIPAGDVSFYKTLDRDFANNMKEASASTLDMCNGILRQAGGQSVEELKDGDDMKDRFDIVVDVVDNMLEKVVSKLRLRGAPLSSLNLSRKSYILEALHTHQKDYDFVFSIGCCHG